MSKLPSEAEKVSSIRTHIRATFECRLCEMKHRLRVSDTYQSFIDSKMWRCACTFAKALQPEPGIEQHDEVMILFDPEQQTADARGYGQSHVTVSSFMSS